MSVDDAIELFPLLRQEAFDLVGFEPECFLGDMRSVVLDVADGLYLDLIEEYLGESAETVLRRRSSLRRHIRRWLPSLAA